MLSDQLVLSVMCHVEAVCSVVMVTRPHVQTCYNKIINHNTFNLSLHMCVIFFNLCTLTDEAPHARAHTFPAESQSGDRIHHSIQTQLSEGCKHWFYWMAVRAYQVRCYWQGSQSAARMLRDRCGWGSSRFSVNRRN